MALWPGRPAPTVCPDLLPAGWELDLADPIDFDFTDGTWAEVYVLRRTT